MSPRRLLMGLTLLAVVAGTVAALQPEATRTQRLLQGATAITGCLAALSMSRRADGLERGLTVLGLATRRLASGDPEARVRLDGPAEATAVAGDINRMAEELQRLRHAPSADSERVLQDAVDALPEPFWIVDATGRLRSANAAARRLLREGRSEPSDDRLRQACARVQGRIRTGGGADLYPDVAESVRLTGPDGDVHWLVRAAPILTGTPEVNSGVPTNRDRFAIARAGEAGPPAVVFSLEDVSRLRRFEELRHDWVATVAHELRTPLTSLRMALHLCLEEAAGPLAERQRELLAAAREDGERLQSIGDELLEVSRLQAGGLDLDLTVVPAADLAREARDVHARAAAARSLTLTVEVLPDCPAVRADRERAGLTLANLVGNAIRHAAEGGRVVVAAQADGSFVRFEVVDDGPGVPPEYRTRVFERFFRVPGRPGGASGLGLAIARDVVVAHGGRIGVEDAPGGGSRFWLTLPAAE